MTPTPATTKEFDGAESPGAAAFAGFTFDRPRLSDVDGLHGVNRDPAVWRYSPGHRHLSADQTREQVEQSLRLWDLHGLDYWIIHDADAAVLGSGGVRKLESYWNLFARLSPSVQGHGLASAIQRAALTLARQLDPSLPILGRLREPNIASRSLMERVGLRYQMTTSAGDGGHDWLVYADRTLPEHLRERLRG